MENLSAKSSRLSFGALLVCSGALLFQVSGAKAQTAPTASPADTQPPTLDEVIVTAQRRSENLQNVPIAVTALSSRALEAARVTSVTDLRLSVPSLNIVNNNGILSTSLRGVGSTGVNPGFENPVAIYVDGVYLASTVANFFSLADVSQIDVLKGPQGTLFGRNATAGLIQITTRLPSHDASVEARVGYGDHETLEGRFYATGGFGDKVAASLSVYDQHMGEGFGRNRTTGADTYRIDEDLLVRGKALIEPTTSTTILLAADYSATRRNDLAGIALPGTINVNNPAAGPQPDIGYDQIADSPTFKRGWAAGGSAKITQKISALTLTSITAYRQSSYTTAFDYDALPQHLADIQYRQPEDQLSQEIQLQPTTAGRFVWVIGGYYFDAHTAYDPFNFNLYAAGQLIKLVNRQSTESLAGYAQGTYEIVDGTKLTLGGRYTTERRAVFDGLTQVTIPAIGAVIPIPAADENVTFDKFTFRAALDHRFSDNVLGYASFNRGFKSGGYNTGSPGTPPYAPETVDAYEVGLKTDLFHHLLRVNVAGFYDQYRDIQSQNLTMGIISIVNAARARIYGADVDVEARPTERLLLAGGLGWTNANYTYYPFAPIGNPLGGVPSTIGNVSGNQLPLAAKLTVNGAATYTVPLGGGHLAASANVLYNSGYFLESDNVIKQPAFAEVGGTLIWTSPDDHYSLGAFVKNLTDERTLAFSTTLPEGVHGFLYSLPRTFGVTAGLKF